MAANPAPPSAARSKHQWLSLWNLGALALILIGLFLVYGAGFLTDSWKQITALLAAGCAIALIGVGLYISGRANSGSAPISTATTR
jgi:hypothetical protein